MEITNTFFGFTIVSIVSMKEEKKEMYEVTLNWMSLFQINE